MRVTPMICKLAAMLPRAVEREMVRVAGSGKSTLINLIAGIGGACHKRAEATPLSSCGKILIHNAHRPTGANTDRQGGPVLGGCRQNSLRLGLSLAAVMASNSPQRPFSFGVRFRYLSLHCDDFVSNWRDFGRAVRLTQANS